MIGDTVTVTVDLLSGEGGSSEASRKYHNNKPHCGVSLFAFYQSIFTVVLCTLYLLRSVGHD